jgi:hypothetical protein
MPLLRLNRSIVVVLGVSLGCFVPRAASQSKVEGQEVRIRRIETAVVSQQSTLRPFRLLVTATQIRTRHPQRSRERRLRGNAAVMVFEAASCEEAETICRSDAHRAPGGRPSGTLLLPENLV